MKIEKLHVVMALMAQLGAICRKSTNDTERDIIGAVFHRLRKTDTRSLNRNK